METDKLLDSLDELMSMPDDISDIKPPTMDLDDILASTSQLRVNPSPPTAYSIQPTLSSTVLSTPKPQISSSVHSTNTIVETPPLISNMNNHATTSQSTKTPNTLEISSAPIPTTSTPTTSLSTANHVMPTTMSRKLVTATTASVAIANNVVKPIKTPTTGQHIVLLQKPGGAVQQIRISTGAQGSNPGSSSSPSNIQLVKVSDGSFLQIKNTNNKVQASNIATSITQTTTTSTKGGVNAMGNGLTEYTIKNGGVAQRILIANNPSLKVATSITPTSKLPVSSSSASITPTPTGSGLASVSGISTGTPRTMTVAEAQKLGLLSSAKIQELVSKATAQKKAKAAASALESGSTTTPISSSSSQLLKPVAQPGSILLPVTTTNLRPISKPIDKASSAVPTDQSTTVSSTPVSAMPLHSKKIVIQTAEGVHKEVTLPPHLYRLAQEGRIKAVTINGQSNQYIRLNQPKSSKIPDDSTDEAATATSTLKFRNGDEAIAKPITKMVATSSRALVTSQTASLKIRPITMLPPPTSNTTSEISETSSGTLLNRSFKLRETINPDQLIRRDSHSNDDSQTMYFGSARRSIKTETVPQQPLETSALELNASETEDGPRRKHCNCAKSQCLKLYCDCFANGEFCQNCNCKDCFNNLDNQEERQKAIQMCLERNPQAFKPKIGKGKDTTQTLRRHTKGCNCKRSGCLKNYCECYEAKIGCSENCKCIDCHNQEEPQNRSGRAREHSFSEHNVTNHYHSPINMNISANNTSGMEFEKTSNSFISPNSLMKRTSRSESPEIPPKKPCNFMTGDVIDATIQCLVAQAEECQKNNTDRKMSERLILEEFGRCLVEIVEFSRTNPDN